MAAKLKDPETLPDATTNAPVAPDTSPAPTSQPTKKRRKKNKANSGNAKNTQITQFSLRRPRWTYIHLQRIPSSTLPSSSSSSSLDAVTTHLHVTAALTQFLGTHGSAIPFDILKLHEQDVWIRVPAEDRSAIISAIGGWIHAASRDGWRVKGWSCWNAEASSGGDGHGGQELFDD